MSLQYLSGIGANRKRSSSGGGGGRKSQAKRSGPGASKYKGALRRIVKAAPKNPVAAARAAKNLMRKHSPLNAIRIKKTLRQTRQRQVFEEQGEPLFVEQEQLEPQDAPQEIDNYAEDAQSEGVEEVDAQEFDTAGSPDDEDSGADMGVIYPDDMSALSGKRSDKKQAKKASSAKGQKKAAKTDKTKAKSELKRSKGQAKLEKAKAGGGKFKESFDKALDTAGKYLDKGKGGDAADEKEPTWFEKNKMLVIGGGAALLIGGFLLMKKK